MNTDKKKLSLLQGTSMNVELGGENHKRKTTIGKQEDRVIDIY